MSGGSSVQPLTRQIQARSVGQLNQERQFLVWGMQARPRFGCGPITDTCRSLVSVQRGIYGDVLVQDRIDIQRIRSFPLCHLLLYLPWVSSNPRIYIHPSCFPKFATVNGQSTARMHFLCLHGAIGNSEVSQREN